MKKIVSVLVCLLFFCAAFFVFADVSYSSDDVELTPVLSIGPIITTIDLPVNIPDPNLKAALHDATGVPSGDLIFRSHLAALSGSLNFSSRGISDLEGIQFCSGIETLNLDGNNLSGVLADMSGMADLETLSLDGNNFTTVPEALCTIPNLRHLSMNNNPIISVSLDLGCTGLRRLELNGCHLSAFPSELIDDGLTHLELARNDIGSLPADIDDMTSIVWLDVEECGLSTLPAALYNMSWLERLYAECNEIESLSADIGGMTSLAWLSLGYNELGGLPNELCSLNNLTNLLVDHNEIYNLPSGIGNTNLVELSASFNNISSIPSSIGNADHLEVLDLMLNRITELPGTFDDIDYDVLNIEFNFIDLSPGSPDRALIDGATISTAYVDRQMMPVTNLIATPTDTEISLSWDACEDGSQDGATWTVDSYAVYTYDGSLHKLDDVPKTEMTYTHTGLGPGTDLSYRVRVNYHVEYSLHGIDEMARCYTRLDAATLTEAPATPAPTEDPAEDSSEDLSEDPTEDPGEASEEDAVESGGDETEIEIDADDLPEGTAAIETPDGEIVPVGADGSVRFTIDEADLRDGLKVVALDGEGAPLGVVDVAKAVAGKSIDLKPTSGGGFPLWAIIVICIAGAGAIGTGAFFGIRALKKRRGDKPPKPPKSPKPPKGTSGKRTTEL